MKIEELIAVLTEQSQLRELTAEQLTDILWLARERSRFSDLNNQKKPISDPGDSPVDDRKEQKSSTRNNKGKQTQKTSNYSEKASEYNKPSTEVYCETKSDTERSQATGVLPIRITDAPALQNKLELSRSLKPLIRNIPSKFDRVFNEVATAERIANERYWIPVFEPAKENWLDLDLIVDRGASMWLWKNTILEIQQILENLGAFRNIRTWSLFADNEIDIVIKPGISSISRNQDDRSPKELINPDSRGLVLLLSDCISPFWRNGLAKGLQDNNIVSALKIWAENGSIAIAQMLPEWLWAKTSLSLAAAVQLSAGTSGIINQQMKFKQLSLWDEIDRDKDIKVPILTLEAKSFSNWCQTITGVPKVYTSGVIFISNPEDLNDEDEKGETELNNISSQLVPEQLFQRFRLTSSPIAKQLASLLAVAPIVTLPVIRLIQKTMLPQSTQVHVAEVLFSGLLKSNTEEKIDLDTDQNLIEYQFVEGVKEFLINSLASTDRTIVKFHLIEQLTRHIVDRLGLSVETFAGFLKDPKQMNSTKPQINPIAEIAIEKLKKLGGKYSRFAEKIETKPTLKTFPFQIAKMIAIKTEKEEPLALEIQTFEYQVASIETKELFEIAAEIFLAETGRNLKDPESLLLEGTLAKQTYKQIVDLASFRGLAYSESRFKSIASSLWKVFSKATDRKVIKTNLPEILKEYAAEEIFKINRVRQVNEYFLEKLGNQIFIEMIKIPEGTFLMSSPEDEPNKREYETPQHQVNVFTFFMGRYPITQAQWKAVAQWDKVERDLDPDPSYFKEDYEGITRWNRPVERVTWDDAIEFCKRLSKRTKREYRLPSEAQWEYACRAGTTTPFHFGETVSAELANYDGNYSYGQGVKGEYREQTTPIEYFGVANAFGLSDMHGNVWEWCEDDWHDNYDNAPLDGTAWISSASSAKVIRGGSWYDNPSNCRSAYRDNNLPGPRYNNIGFRVVRIPPRTS